MSEPEGYPTGFPVDDVTLALIESACLGDDGQSHLSEVLTFGSEHVDTDADGVDHYEGGWHPNDVVLALIDEIRWLRNEPPPLPEAGVRVYIEPRDWWVGYYRGDRHHYVCPLPCVVIRWPRRSTPDQPLHASEDTP